MMKKGKKLREQLIHGWNTMKSLEEKVKADLHLGFCLVVYYLVFFI